MYTKIFFKSLILLFSFIFLSKPAFSQRSVSTIDTSQIRSHALNNKIDTSNINKGLFDKKLPVANDSIMSSYWEKKGLNVNLGNTNEKKSIDLNKGTKTNISNKNTLDAPESRRIMLPINDMDSTAIDTFQILITPWSSYKDPNEPKVNQEVIKDSKLKLSLTINLKDITSIDSLFIKYGFAPGLGNALNLKFNCRNINGKYFLVSSDGTNEVSGNVATLILPVSTTLIAQKNYLWVKGKRKNGTYTSDYIK